ncbi:hypothetical protein JKP88DRAFT_273023 [Tribonema minus]|uniref:Uncharacterized protein n=1 Tax=Tribonema minus TaxID=303371 RepID=A0A835YZV8_9STRA|nr:hypothetical protein JKP88DRAFT_273023 [Tribonema minus]
MSQAPTAFPHDQRLAAKTVTAGVVALNDLVCEDTYSIMSRASATARAAHVSATYALDSDTSAMVEETRLVHSVEDGDAASTLLLLRHDGAGNKTMEAVLGMTPASTYIRSVDPDGTSAVATFAKGGLRWDDANAAIYLGGDTFRIKYAAGDAESNSKPCLLIQAKNGDSTYTTKFSIARDDD